MPTTIAVEGMSCAHCEETVEEALRSVEGVTDAVADRDAAEVSVEGVTDVTALRRAVEDAGYTTPA